METEVMWLNMLRMVQFAVRFGVFACIMAIPLEESGGHAYQGRPEPVPVTADMAFQEADSLSGLHPETGEGIDMADRSDVLVSSSGYRPEK